MGYKTGRLTGNGLRYYILIQLYPQINHVMLYPSINRFVKRSIYRDYHGSPKTFPVQIALSLTQPAITCPKLTIETLEQGVKYVQS